MKKMLYIGSQITKPKGGGDQVNLRNQTLLENIFFDKIVFVQLPPCSIINKFALGITAALINQIDRLLTDGKFDYIFLSTSQYGRLARFVKKKFPEIQVVTFFHNIELQYAEEYRKTYRIKSLPFYYAVKYWEKRCCKNTDIFIMLNNRDSLLLERIYHKKASLVLPTSFDDKFDESKARNIEDKPAEVIDYLFVGYAFFANIHGIQWFIDNVMPKVEGHLYIIGNGMDKVMFTHITPNIHIYGFVDDISDYYYRAKMIISPIFVGGGMKTKTAEALMYGKTILGTKEAFEGYVIKDECMYLCNSDIEFVETIKVLYNSCQRINEKARSLFIQNYSNAIAEKNLKNLFCQDNNFI